MLRPELTERILRLRVMPILQSLPSRELAQLAATMRSRTFQKGEVILHEDLPPKSFFMIRNGVVTMRRRGKRIGTVQGPGGVGFMSVLARTAGGTGAVAQATVDSYELSSVALDEVFEDHFAVLLGTIRFVAERFVGEMRAQNPPPDSPPAIPYADLVGEHELGIVERIFLLRQTRAFAEANVNTLATMARRMNEVRVPAGTVIWSPGDRAVHSQFIVKGMGRLEGDEGRVQIVGPGYVIGGAEALVGKPRWNRFITDEPMILLQGEASRLVDLFEDDHDLALRFLSMIAAGLMMAWDKKAEMGIASVGTGKPESDPPPALEEAAAPPP